MHGGKTPGEFQIFMLVAAFAALVALIVVFQVKRKVYKAAGIPVPIGDVRESDPFGEFMFPGLAGVGILLLLAAFHPCEWSEGFTKLYFGALGLWLTLVMPVLIFLALYRAERMLILINYSRDALLGAMPAILLLNGAMALAAAALLGSSFTALLYFIWSVVKSLCGLETV